MLKNKLLHATCAAAVAAAFWAATFSVRADPPPSMYNPHEAGRFGPVLVTDLVLSPDGRHLAAAYFMLATNRPGTNWDAWVAEWDLTTGKRTIVPNATRPLAVSPDGQWLAMGHYERAKKTGFDSIPPHAFALWRMGEVRPVRTLNGEDDQKTPQDSPAEILACTFSADGTEIYAIRDDGCMMSWETANDSPGKKGDALSLLYLKHVKLGPKANLLATKSGGVYLLASIRNYPADRRVCGVEANWHKSRQWSSGSSRFIEACSDHYFFRYPSNYSNIPVALSLPSELEPSDFMPARKSCVPLPTSRTAFSPIAKPDVIAYRRPDAALAVVRQIRGEQLSQFPAEAVHAFMPDGKKLIVSDLRSVLRFWDFENGCIARTLRLDDKPPDTFLVAAIQSPSGFGRPEINRRELDGAVRRAASAGAAIVVLPETAVTGYMSLDLKQTWQVGNRPVSEGLAGVDPRDAAETVPGPSTNFFGDVARQCGIYLSVPLLETDRKTGKYYNTVVLIGPDGNTLIHYRKLNPWPWAERGWAEEGNLGRPVVDTPFGRLGVLICFDIHKQAAELAKLKIDTLLYSIAWVEEKDSDWFSNRLPKIAAKHAFNIVAANWSLPPEENHPSWYGYGQSRVVDSAGQVLAKAERVNGLEIIYAELPLPKLENTESIVAD